MNKAFRLMFWGYIFIFFRIQFGIDLLADPIGYYLIYLGADLMTERFPAAKKAEKAAFVGILISVPGVFVNLSEVTGGLWTLYAEGLFIWKVITVYYLFGAWKSAIQNVGQSRLRQRVQITYVWYMGIHFVMMLLTAFSLNVGGNEWSSVFLFFSLMVIAMDIVLLALIAALRRMDWETPIELDESSPET
ncbi:hypothetical protein [Sporosarcina cascadiensis]|uniref:hypothetical protein n=1 Tax=Sporosarcina cascadiensis TaxID=2660747 RepID=UPI00129A6235|nr:hypothetical protein [Sporosarcina cascadiensis]